MPLSTYILTQGGRRWMHKMTQFFMRVEKKLDEITDSSAQTKPHSIPDIARCPITGMQMTFPVIASDCISYEKAALEAWFKQMGPFSPVSLSRLDTQSLPPNRGLKDIVDALPQETNSPTPEIITRVRLRASLQWIVKCKCSVDKEEDFNAVLSTFIDKHPVSQHTTWPLVIDAPLCAELAWRCYKHFRMLVYMEFSVMLNEPITEEEDGTTHIRNYPITMAQTHFVQCLREHPFVSKTQQLTYALQSHNPSFKEEQISKEWSDFWGEVSMRPPPLRQQSNIGHTRTPPPQNRGQHDWSRPHEGGYEDYGTAGPQHYAWGWPNNS
jgi:hypothetical protein